MFQKKGQELPLSTIIVLIIAVIVLIFVVIVYWEQISKIINTFVEITPKKVE